MGLCCVIFDKFALFWEHDQGISDSQCTLKVAYLKIWGVQQLFGGLLYLSFIQISIFIKLMSILFYDGNLIWLQKLRSIKKAKLKSYYISKHLYLFRLRVWMEKNRLPFSCLLYLWFYISISSITRPAIKKNRSVFYFSTTLHKIQIPENCITLSIYMSTLLLLSETYGHRVSLLSWINEYVFGTSPQHSF